MTKLKTITGERLNVTYRLVVANRNRNSRHNFKPFLSLYLRRLVSFE